MENWYKLKNQFDKLDVRKLTGNFLPGILKKAQDLEEGMGLHIIQSFEPIPLYSTLKELGFEYITDKISDVEYHVYFYRIKKIDSTFPGGLDIPLKPTAIVNFNKIDPKLADNVVNFWNYIWGKGSPAISTQTRLLLSLANGVGAGRMRQATREFIKAYSIGVTIAEFDELFALFAWNQGIGHFASEIGPSSLFAVYSYAKSQEEKGTERSEILKKLLERFGENNPDVGTFFKSS